MRPKQNQPQSFAKPTSIKLSPFTKLPKLQLHSSSTSPTNNDSFPISKAITQPSQLHNYKHNRFKTQGEYRQQESASFRLISRFIYNHLQKKINFNAQIIKNYPNLSLDIDHNGAMRRQKQEVMSTKSNKYDSSTYSYQKYNPTHVRQSNHTLLLKFKNKHIKSKAMQRSMIKEEVEPTRNKGNKSRYANIDSYFDLSCLQDKIA